MLGFILVLVFLVVYFKLLTAVSEDVWDGTGSTEQED